jgi:diphosphomevalonate decarboxylase
MWKASAPSNIALIKYMGKESGAGNVAVNPSLSMTLGEFRTNVEVERASNGPDRWEPLAGSTPLRVESTKRFVEFFTRIKTDAKIEGSFILRSGNNFPSDAGLASSASSFAALTQAAFLAFSDVSGRPIPPPSEQALVSRTGSGSSCRSFFSPWCAWEGTSIGEVPCKLPELTDLVAVIDKSYKKISSSEAHKRVQSSPLFEGRSARANQRQKDIKIALADGNFQRTAEIAWAELWDMHSLFHTSDTPFFYLSPLSISVLRWAEESWEKTGRGPIATIDAGPNVHLLVPTAEKDRFRQELLELLPQGTLVVESHA